MKILKSRHATILMSLVVILGITACTHVEQADGAFAGVELTPARAKPDFTLTDEDGRGYDFRASTAGHLTLLFFGYTHCPDVCPLQLTNVSAAVHMLSASDRARTRVLFVTTDPARDSAAQLRSWLANFDASIVGLRGPSNEVNQIEHSLGLAASARESDGRDYTVGHAAQVLVFTPDDSLRFVYSRDVAQQEWIADLPKMLAIRSRR